MVRVFDNSYRNYRADQRERANEFGGWNIHDKFKRPMGSLGAYLANARHMSFFLFWLFEHLKNSK